MIMLLPGRAGMTGSRRTFSHGGNLELEVGGRSVPSQLGKPSALDSICRVFG